MNRKKKFIISILFIFYSGYARATNIWIIAPGIFSEKNDLLESTEKKVESSIKHFGKDGIKIKIIANTKDGFSVSYYLFLKKFDNKSLPDYIVYYQPARFFSYDLEEFLLADVDDSLNILSIDNSSYKKQDLRPKFLENFFLGETLDKLKKYLFLKSRITEFTSTFADPDQDECLMDMSSWPLQQLARHFLTSPGNKTKFVLFLSPERIRYFKDLFNQNKLTDAIIRLVNGEMNISRSKQKDLMRSLPLNTYFLPARFGDLHQREYLMENSTIHLNSAGIDRWAEFMGAAIADAKSPIK